MKLLYTLTMYPPSTGGAQLHQHLLAQHLQPGHSVTVVTHWDRNRTDWLLGTTLRAPARSCDYRIDNVPVHRLGLSTWEKISLTPFVLTYYPLMDWALAPIAMCIERHLMEYAADATLVHNVRIGREGLSYASLNVARRRDIPFVLTPVHHPRWSGWRYRAYNNLYTEADLVIALTQAEKQVLVGLGVREDRVVVTGHGPIVAVEAHPTRFLAEHHISGPVILFLGQHYSYKGYRELLRAAPLVWKRIPEAEFVFIGPPVGHSEREFERFADHRIHRLGNVDLQVKTDVLAACSLVCVPSSQESFGGVYTEAWSFKKPVIGCNIAAVAEVITDGVDGHLVEQQPDMIAERIIDLLLSPARAGAMGSAGWKKVRERYSWPRLAERTAHAYQMVLS